MADETSTQSEKMCPATNCFDFVLAGDLDKHLAEKHYDAIREKQDNVNHPKHYTSHPSGIECIEITRHMNFNCGNVIKYVWRAGLKPNADLDADIEDLEKALWYLQDEIKERKRKANVLAFS